MQLKEEKADSGLPDIDKRAVLIIVLLWISIAIFTALTIITSGLFAVIFFGVIIFGLMNYLFYCIFARGEYLL